MKHIYDVIIIGASQAGIAMSQQLKQKGFENHMMIDAQKRIGESWRSRYKSLILFTPKSYSALPGLKMKGDPDSYPTKDEMADYLETYVSYFNLPYKLDTAVSKVEKENNHFNIFIANETLRAKKVVVATGAFHRPSIPPLIRGRITVPQVHSSLYTESKDLNAGSVLVVGGGNSGAQIAVELSTHREVILAISHKPKFLPLQLFGKSIFHWLEKLQLLYAGTNTLRGRTFQRKNDPIFGKELKNAIKNKMVQIKPRVTEVVRKQVFFSDGSILEVDQIIWATGFISSYEMIHIDGAIDKSGKPLHNRGISPIDGLYYIGLPWQHNRGSALVCGVGKDAMYLIDKLNLNR
ncbi:flavin-containing monooxygenase [Lederbergia lenta]|uniref:flavin-containing monooxygenase n=1 Tax=Lederbergia lenta TaxID=1467 RepID=UPI00255985F8|nr:NAD(P)/FAD-dependent oxidoreductase [Lederbergia lenta]